MDPSEQHQREILARYSQAEETAREGPYQCTHFCQRLEVLRQGVAKIITNDTGGVYTITEQWQRPAKGSIAAVWENATEPLGFVTATTRDYQNRIHGSADDLVRFWEQRKCGGGLEILIDVGEVEFWAEITGYEVADSPAQNRWNYSWSEVEKTAAGYDGWLTLAGGRTGAYNGYNSIEEDNTGADTEGNGVNVSNLDTEDYTFTIQPAALSAVVRMHTVGFLVGSAQYTEYWFSYENGVDGSCD